MPLKRDVEALTESDAVHTSTVEAFESEFEAQRKEQTDFTKRNTEFHLEIPLLPLIEEFEHESTVLVDDWRQCVVVYQEFMSKFVEMRTRIVELKLKLDSFREKMQRAKRRS